MGVIKRQSIKQSLVTYLAIIIGTINILFIYTSTLTKEELGMMRFIIDTPLLLLPFIYLGSNSLTYRFFPNFRNEENKNNGFLFILLFVPLIGFILFSSIFFLNKSSIYSAYSIQLGKHLPYLVFLIPMLFLQAYVGIFSTYSTNFKRIVVPAIINNLFVKISIPTLTILYFLGYFSFSGILNGVIIIYSIVLLALIGYLHYLGGLSFKPKLSFLNKPLLKEMGSFAFFGILGSLGSILATRIDSFMVTSLLNTGYNGIFTIAATMSTVIDVPRRAISGIAAPIIAQAWEDDNIEHIKDLYKKSSLNQFIIGLFILIGIWVNIDDIFAFIPKGDEFILGKYVVLFLGLAKIADMVSGVNHEIIMYSKYYRFNFYAILCLAIFNIIANFLLIPKYQINGAALATLASLSLFNFTKFVYIYYKTKMQPLSIETLWVFLTGLFTLGLAYIIPSTELPFVDILIRSVSVTLVYGSIILYFNISPDINDLVKQGLGIIKSKF